MNLLTDPPVPMTVPGMILAQAKRLGNDAVAIEFYQGGGEDGTVRVTYAELLAMMEAVGKAMERTVDGGLRNEQPDRGLNGRVVLTTINDGAEALAVFLTVMSVNGCCVPVEPNDPRLGVILALSLIQSPSPRDGLLSRMPSSA